MEKGPAPREQGSLGRGGAERDLEIKLQVELKLMVHSSSSGSFRFV